MSLSANKSRLKQIFTSYWEYLTLYAACKLDILETIAQRPTTAAALAPHAQLHEPSLQQMLEALAHLDLLELTPQGYQLTDVGALLTAAHPDSLKNACLLWAEEHLEAWLHLDKSLRSGVSSFEQRYAMGYFDYLAKHPDKAAIYHRAMREYARDDYSSLPQKVDFKPFLTIADVGGGTGTVLEILAKADPNHAYILLEQTEVLQHHPPHPRIRPVAGDFFQPLPFRANALLLCRVLHDWDDADALRILTNCRAALLPEGRIFIVENLHDEVQTHLLGLNMLAMCSSRERTRAEYTHLLEKAGLAIESTTPLNALQTILVAAPKPRYTARALQLSDDQTHYLYQNQPVFGQTFAEALKFHAEGLAAVADESGWYHIDLEGKPLYAERYARTFGYYCQRAAVQTAQGWTHLDVQGQPIYAARYSWAGNFQENCCAVRLPDGSYQHIGLDGKPLYAETYAYVGDFKDGYACVRDAAGRAYHVDTQGRARYASHFVEVGVYHKRFATARDANGWTHIDRFGQPLYAARYLAVEPFYNGQALVTTHAGKSQIIDEHGAVQLEIGA